MKLRVFKTEDCGSSGWRSFGYRVEHASRKLDSGRPFVAYSNLRLVANCIKHFWLEKGGKKRRQSVEIDFLPPCSIECPGSDHGMSRRHTPLTMKEQEVLWSFLREF